MRLHFLLFVLTASFCFTPGFGFLSFLLCRSRPITKSFCENPPVVNDVDLNAYTGTWYQLATAGNATAISSTFCTTANYTLTPSGSIDVLNCKYEPRSKRPRCTRGIATRREGAKTSQLQVSFSKFAPPGRYNVATLVGNANYGYFGAVVYNCRVKEGKFVEDVFYIARSPFKASLTLLYLQQKMKCMGYTNRQDLVYTNQEGTCKYFSGADGFDLRDPFARR